MIHTQAIKICITYIYYLRILNDDQRASDRNIVFFIFYSAKLISDLTN